jgi:14-3-3 protein epsilon
METTANDNYFLAQSLLTSGATAEAVTCVKNIIEQSTEFNRGFISLFSAVYKASVAPLRETIRRLDMEINVLQQEKKAGILNKILPIRESTFQELKEKCNEAIDIINSKLLPEAKEASCMATLYKTKADFLRYIAEFSREGEKNKAISAANSDYAKALEICKENLIKCHPVSLDVILNYAVFEYEQLRAQKQALDKLETILREAELELGSLSEEEQKESLSLLTNIRTNIGIWENDEA